MMITNTWFIDSLKRIFTPAEKEKRVKEPDERINKLAPERIKRSPGHENLSKYNDEPEWYHDV